MKDSDCVSFLQWCLPQMGYRWPGFRKVRGQVCKRIARRMRELGIEDVQAYRDRVSVDEREWKYLYGLCRITISRFYRDRQVFELLREQILPALAGRAIESGRESVDAWSCGCCSGEEPYTLQIIWQLSVMPTTGTGLPLRIVATDVDPNLLDRARRGVYPRSSLKDLPGRFAEAAFEEHDGDRLVRPAFRRDIEWVLQDIRSAAPPGPFDIVLCRNVAFTYFDEPVQSEVLERIYASTRDGGYLVIGSHERLPVGCSGLFDEVAPCVFEKKP